MARPLDCRDDRLLILDQTRLPHQEVVLDLTGADDTADALVWALVTEEGVR